MKLKVCVISSKYFNLLVVVIWYDIQSFKSSQQINAKTKFEISLTLGILENILKHLKG